MQSSFEWHMFAFRKPDHVLAGRSLSGALSAVMLCEERDRKKTNKEADVIHPSVMREAAL